MKLQARQVHIFGIRRRIQPVKNPAYAVGLPGVDPSALALAEEPIEPLVSEGPNHDTYVMFYITGSIVMGGIAMSSRPSYLPRRRLTRFVRQAHDLPQRPLRTLGKRESGRRTRPDASA
jgi:hypothetical protein